MMIVIIDVNGLIMSVIYDWYSADLPQANIQSHRS